MKTTIEMNEDIMTRLKAPIDVKFSMWDFAGQDVYHVRRFTPLLRIKSVAHCIVLFV